MLLLGAPCIRHIGNYPSGHSTRATLYAEVLAEVFPDQRQELLERGREIGWDRVIAGVHYPSDVSAGRVLGHELRRQMLANEALQERMNTVKAELAKAKQLPVMASQKQPVMNTSR